MAIQPSEDVNIFTSFVTDCKYNADTTKSGRTLKQLHILICQQCLYTILGHAGHDEPPKSSILTVPTLQGNESKYGLRGQVEHKIEFINTYVPKDVKIHFIGHSIGAWMILELMKIPEIQSRIQHCYMLFPVIERMAFTANGSSYMQRIKPFWSLLRYIFVLFAILPYFIQILMMSCYFYVKSIPTTHLGTAIKHLRLSITDKMVHMANEEMDIVRDADIKTITENKNLLTFYYGANDDWAPPEFCTELKKRVIDVDAEIDLRNIDHAFVLQSSMEMGELVGSWILKHKRHSF